MEGVHGVQKEDGVVGEDLGEGPEGVLLAVPQGHEGLDQAVGVGAGGGKAQEVGEAHGARAVRPPMRLARVALSPPLAGARRRPNSRTTASPAASRTRLALVAMRVS